MYCTASFTVHTILVLVVHTVLYTTHIINHHKRKRWREQMMAHWYAARSVQYDVWLWLRKNVTPQKSRHTKKDTLTTSPSCTLSLLSLSTTHCTHIIKQAPWPPPLHWEEQPLHLTIDLQGIWHLEGLLISSSCLVLCWENERGVVRRVQSATTAHNHFGIPSARHMKMAWKQIGGKPKLSFFTHLQQGMQIKMTKWVSLVHSKNLEKGNSRTSRRPWPEHKSLRMMLSIS